MSRDLLTDLNDNWPAWVGFTADHFPGGASASFGSIRCASVGLPLALFNQAFVFEDPEPDDFAAAVEWMAQRGAPFWVTTPESLVPVVAPLTASANLDEVADTVPGMVVSLSDGLPGEPTDVSIVRVADAAQLEDVAVVIAEAFDAPVEAARLTAPPSTLDDDRCAWFMGHVDGETVACGQLLVTDDVAGVYTIGVRERFRRQGLGAAITREVLAAGVERGCSVGVLQASELGAPVYARMGFGTMTNYHRFGPPE